LLFLGTIEDGNRRQGTFDGAVDKQRGLLFLEHTFARRRRLAFHGRGNHHRCAAFLAVHVLGQGFLAFQQAFLDPSLLTLVAEYRRGHLGDYRVQLTQLGLLRLAFQTRLPPAGNQTVYQLDQVEGDLAGQVHQAEPGKIGKHGQAK